MVLQAIGRLGQSLTSRKDDNPVTEAHLRQAERDIARYLQNPAGNAPKCIAPGRGARRRSRYPLSPGPPLGGGD